LHIAPAELLRVGEVAAREEELGPAGDAVFEAEVDDSVGRVVDVAFETGGVAALAVDPAVLDQADVGAQPAPAVAERGLDLALVEVLEIGADVAVGVLELRQVVVVEAALEGEAAGNVRQKRVNSN